MHLEVESAIIFIPLTLINTIPMKLKPIFIFVLDTLLYLLLPWRMISRNSLVDFKPKSILFCRTDHIGDVYLSLPALALVRNHYPDSHLVVLAPSWAESLFRVAGCQDELLICDPPWWTKKRKNRFGTTGSSEGGWLALWRTIQKIRSQNFDLCIEMRGDVRQIIAFGWLGGAKRLLTRERNGGAGLADLAPKIDESLHECEQNIVLVRSLGISETKPIFATPYSASDALHVHNLLTNTPITPMQGGNTLTILIHPGAKWVNHWPMEYYSDLITALGNEYPKLSVILTGSGSESDVCQKISDSLPERSFVLAGKLKLTETAALMSLVDLVIMADTGPMHFLNAITTPAVLLFGPTSPTRFAPYGEHIEVISAGDCCHSSLHEFCTRSSPDTPSDCMARISVSKVLCRARKLLTGVADFV